MAVDQKNTIVKCTVNPSCLFNHNGICDNYVITIGADGSCQEYVETELKIEETKRCHEDCIHFDDSDPMVGPLCLFKHPEPLKEFYDGMPCDYYHKRNSTPHCEDFKPIRGQRAKGNFYEDTCDDKIAVKIKIAELNKPNKNKRTIRDVVPKCDLPICDWSCKHALSETYAPLFNPNTIIPTVKALTPFKPIVGINT